MLERPALLKDVAQQWNLPGQSLATQEAIEEYIEYPLRKAVTRLLEIGITPYWSTANRHDVSQGDGLAIILINEEYMTDPQRHVAEREFGYESGQRIGIEMPVNEETPVEDIEQYFLKQVEKFANP